MSDVESGWRSQRSPEATGFSFALEERKHVTFTDGSLNVADNGSVLDTNELGLNLGNSSS